MQGAFVNYSRPKTKKALKEAIASGQRVNLEATSIFGNEYDGPIADAPDGKYYVVGPDPWNKRSWYAQIIKQGGKVTVK